jgi:hypothetical protein
LGAPSFRLFAEHCSLRKLIGLVVVGQIVSSLYLLGDLRMTNRRHVSKNGEHRRALAHFVLPQQAHIARRKVVLVVTLKID